MFFCRVVEEWYIRLSVIYDFGIFEKCRDELDSFLSQLVMELEVFWEWCF